VFRGTDEVIECDADRPSTVPRKETVSFLV